MVNEGPASENLHITSHSAPLSEADLQRTPHPAPSQPPVQVLHGRKRNGGFRAIGSESGRSTDARQAALFDLSRPFTIPAARKSAGNHAGRVQSNSS
jgi:hypothetical protein